MESVMSSKAYYIAQVAIFVALLMVSASAAGCEVIGGIFKAGIFIGIIAVVLIIAAVGFLVRMLRR
jgi:hypothetical protein